MTVRGLGCERSRQKDWRGGLAFEAMRERWLLAIAKDPDLPPRAAAVAIVIAKYLNRETGVAWPAMATIVPQIAGTERTVQRALAALELAGYLERQLGKGRDSTVYGISERFAAAAVRREDFIPRRGDRSVTPASGDGGDGGDAGERQGCRPCGDDAVAPDVTGVSPKPPKATSKGTSDGNLRFAPPPAAVHAGAHASDRQDRSAEKPQPSPRRRKTEEELALFRALRDAAGWKQASPRWTMDPLFGAYDRWRSYGLTHEAVLDMLRDAPAVPDPALLDDAMRAASPLLQETTGHDLSG